MDMDGQGTELNQVILSGQVVSAVKRYTGPKVVFTLGNAWGRFYVQWSSPHWMPRRGDQVIIHGTMFSVFKAHGHVVRIQATEIVLMRRERELATRPEP